MSKTLKKFNPNFIGLFFRYLLRKLNFQHYLFILVFLTFDIGDAVTASLMMDIKGIDAEHVFIIKHIYVDFGLIGLVVAKLCFPIVPLMIASLKEKKSYWLINGVLVALIIVGIMATRANLQTIAGLPHMNHVEIILIYYVVLFILAIGGMILDHIILQRMKVTS